MIKRNDVALAISKYDQFDFLIDIVPREEIKPQKKETHSPTASNTNSAINLQNSAVLNPIDPNTANLISAINSSNSSTSVLQNGNHNSNGNVQYFFAVPTTNNNQTSTTSNGLPLQLQGIQTIQNMPNNIHGIQAIQGIQGIQGLQGAQIILSSTNGQPAVFSVGNRDC